VNSQHLAYYDRDMLPNLSALNARTLSVEVKRGADEAGFEPPPESSATSVRRLKVQRGPLQDVDWKALFKRMYYGYNDDGDLQDSITFFVHVPRPSGRPWRIKFELEETSLFIQAATTDLSCVKAILESANQDISVDALFYKIDEDTRALCTVKPNARDETGYGSVVLQVLDVIAGARGGNLTLGDAASFRDNGTRPKVNVQDEVTPTLQLLRGFGFYESRGFISRKLFNAESDKSLYAAATEVDLEWTHMVVTTPINQLVEAIRIFYTRVDFRGKSVPAFTRELYSRAFCAAHATRAKLDFVDPFTTTYDPVIRTGGNCPERLGVASYSDVSMRVLAQATANGLVPEDTVWDAEDMSYWASILFRSVWQRPQTVRYKDGKAIPLYYPDTSLTKVLYTASDGTLMYNAVQANPQVPGGVPVVRLQPVRTDLVADFNENDNVAMVVRG
jgi:hypothetical protein